jgi:hypothetical protein
MPDDDDLVSNVKSNGAVSKHLEDVRNADYLRRNKEMLVREQDINKRLMLQKNLVGGVDMMHDDDLEFGMNQIKYETCCSRMERKVKKCSSMLPLAKMVSNMSFKFDKSTVSFFEAYRYILQYQVVFIICFMPLIILQI